MDNLRHRHGWADRRGTLDLFVSERFLLRFCLIAIIVTYGAIGRDIFFSRLSGQAGEDFIGANLIYMRLGSSTLAIVVCLLLSRSAKVLLSIPLLFVPCVLVILASVFWTDDVKGTLRGSLAFALMMPAIVMISQRLGFREVASTIIKLLAATLILSAIFAIFVPSIGRHAASDVIQSVHAGRWRGIFGHKNGLGPHAAYGIILFWLYPALLDSRHLLWFARASAVACLIFAGSATSMVGAATMAVFGTMFLLHRNIPHLSFSVIIIGSSVVGLFMLGLIFGGDVFFTILGRDHTFSGRTFIWELAWVSFLDSPLLGYGYATYGGQVFNGRIESYYGDIAGPENAYFNVILETGLIGAIALLVPVFVCLVRAFRLRELSVGKDRQAAECFVLILLAALVMSVTESTPLMITSYGGPINYTVLFCLSTLALSRIRLDNYSHKSF